MVLSLIGFDATATISSVVAPTPVLGKATSKSTANDTVTINGKTYTAAANIAYGYGITDFGVSTKYDATLLLDPLGYILVAKPGESAITDKAAGLLKVYQTLKDNVIVNVAQVVLSNGTTADFPIASGDVATLNGKLNTTQTYTVDPDTGIYTLADAVAAGTTAPAFKDTVKVTSATSNKADKKVTLTYNADKNKDYYYADGVKFIYLYNGKATVLDGVQTVTDATELDYVLGAQDATKTNALINAVIVPGKPAPASTTTTSDLIFLVGGKTGVNAVTNTSGTVNYNTYDAYTGDTAIENFFATNGTSASAEITASGFYVASKNTDGAYVLNASTKYTNTTTLATSSAAENITLFGNSGKTLTTDAKSYDISSAKIVDTTGGSVNSISALVAAFKTAAAGSKSAQVMVSYAPGTGVATTVYYLGMTKSHDASLLTVTDTTSGSKIVFTVNSDKTITAKDNGVDVADLSAKNIVKANVAFTAAADATGTPTFAGANLAANDKIEVTAADGTTKVTYTFKNAA